MGVVAPRGRDPEEPPLRTRHRADYRRFRLCLEAELAPTEIAVLTRSMLEIMVECGFGIDVPEAERTAGRAITPRGAAGPTALQWLVHVLSGPFVSTPAQ
jgi:hypothetical protein